MAELKHCPFCGRIPKVEDCGANRFFVRCKCGVAQDKLYGQRCDAVRRWNTRKFAKAESAQTVSNDDLISRKAAIHEICEDAEWLKSQGSDWQVERVERDCTILSAMPSAQPETLPYVAEIESEYKKWVNMPHINKPLAKALYEVWKKHDREDVSRNG